MNSTATPCDPLPAIIDRSDFAEALAADVDGVFVANVSAYLSAWQAKIQRHLDVGVPREEFDNLTRLSASIHAAERVIEFFVKVQKLPPVR